MFGILEDALLGGTAAELAIRELELNRLIGPSWVMAFCTSCYDIKDRVKQLFVVVVDSAVQNAQQLFGLANKVKQSPDQATIGLQGCFVKMCVRETRRYA